MSGRVEKKRFSSRVGKVRFADLLPNRPNGEPIRLYLGIAQHARQLLVLLHDDSGDGRQARLVSTQPEKINAFFQRLTRERRHQGEPGVAVLDVCAFNDGRIRLLHDDPAPR